MTFYHYTAYSNGEKVDTFVFLEKRTVKQVKDLLIIDGYNKNIKVKPERGFN